jgi:hypothetical protein
VLHDEEQELQGICTLLEKVVVSRDEDPEGRGEALEKLLLELDGGHPFNGSNTIIQEGTVGNILRHAWALDQETILNAQQEALDEVRQTYVTSINPADLSCSRLFCLLTPPSLLLKSFIPPLPTLLAVSKILNTF